MATGDIVSGIYTTTSVYHYFQPAAGVEIMILYGGGVGNNAESGIYDGVTQGRVSLSDNADYSEGSTIKIGITNTNYLLSYSNTSPPSYSGIQIK
jgi:hypothetical protein